MFQRMKTFVFLLVHNLKYILGSNMWVCRNCMESNEKTLNDCRKCNTPKNIIEHEGTK